MQKEKIPIFYLLSFLGGFSFNIVAPLFVIYGLSLNFSISQVALLFGATRLAVFIFEIPTGIFADSYGRKKSILLTYFLSIFSALICFFSSNFYLLLIGSIVYGLSLTFISGAFEALVVDSFDLSKKENFRNRVFVRMGIASTLGFIFGGFASSVVGYYQIKYIWLIQAIIAICALFMASFFLREKFYPKEKSLDKQSIPGLLIDIIKTPLNLIFKNRKILFMLIISVLISLASAVYLIGWPLIFKNILSLPIYYFGIISSIAAIFFLLGSYLAEKFSLKRGAINIIIVSLLGMLFFYIVFGLSKVILLSVISFIMIDFFNGAFTPLFYSFLNKFIPSDKRATILSFYSLFENGSSGAGEIAAGNLFSLFRATMVILVAPLIILVAFVFFVKVNFTKKKIVY